MNNLTNAFKKTIFIYGPILFPFVYLYLRKPSQHRTLDGETIIGLTDVLMTGAPIRQRDPQHTNNLWVLPAGTIPRNPLEILGGPAFASLIAARCDHVVIDSPPIMAVTDARVLAAFCDQTVLVVRAGVSARQDSEYTRDSILSVGGKLLGVVVNGVRRGNRYGYYGGYGYTDFNSAGASANGNGSANGKERSEGRRHPHAPARDAERPRPSGDARRLRRRPGRRREDMGFDAAASEPAPGK